MGGHIGNGKQWLPWIHVEDLVGIILYAIENSRVKGVINGTSPGGVTTGEFTQTFASAMWRPHWIPLPAPVIKLFNGEEASVVMLEGPNVYPKKILRMGYDFKFPDIHSACVDLV